MALRAGDTEGAVDEHEHVHEHEHADGPTKSTSPSMSLSGEPSTKRRKVRKGTHSCWACKRKKIRCTFTRPDEAAGAAGAVETAVDADGVAGMTCDGCRRRGTPCVSQEVPETEAMFAPTMQSRVVDDRLERMETMMEMLLENATGLATMNKRGSWFGHERGPNEAPRGPKTPRPSRGPPGATQRHVSTTLPEPSADEPVPASTNANSNPSRRVGPHWMEQEYMARYNVLQSVWPSAEDLEAILQALERPARAGLQRVLVLTPYSAVSAAESPPVAHEPARQLLRFPPAGSHLVLVARSLLYLASFLQHMHPRFDPDLVRLRVPHREVIQRILCVTMSVVTGNDSLIGSFEGVQCLVLQGSIQSNQGNLRRAWLAFRRAMTMTQLMGLHRGHTGVSVSLATSQAAVMPRCMWFRILYADRYLSLMLGLPQGLPGDQHMMDAGPRVRRKRRRGTETTETETETTDGGRCELPADAGLDDSALVDLWHDLRRIEKAHAIIAGRIIERNEAWRGEEDDDRLAGGQGDWDSDMEGEYGSGSSLGFENGLDEHDEHNKHSTQAIDAALRRAASSMPSQWWLMPLVGDDEVVGSRDGGCDGAKYFLRTQQLVDQLFHYHLLTQLHLPYMLRHGRPGSDASAPGGRDSGGRDRYAYSKFTCVTASREVLSRVLSLRSRRQVTFFCCRCIDFFALLASMTLCLAHLDSHRHVTSVASVASTTSTGTDVLAHQRRSDRAMMEQVLRSTDDMARLYGDDALSAKSAAFLRRLLDVEHDAALADAAAQGCRDARAMMAQRQASDNADVHIWVPFLGTIRITKDGILRVQGQECVLLSGRPAGPSSAAFASPAVPSASTSALQRPVGLLGVNWPSDVPNPFRINTFDPSVFQPGTNAQNLVNAAAFAGSGNYGSDGYGHGSGGGYGNGSFGGIAPAPGTTLRSIGTIASTTGSGDDWTLQGVDYAFFENLLMHGEVEDDTILNSRRPGKLGMQW